MIALVACLALLALNAFFVAAEFALVKVRVTQLDPAARRGDRRAVAAKAVLGRLDRYLSVTQFGITVASLGLGWIGEPALERLGDWGALVLTGEELGRVGHGFVSAIGLAVLTFLHLLLGELVPKFVAIQHSTWTSLNAALPLRFINAAFSPLLWVLERAQRAVLRLIGVNPNVGSEGTLSEEEIIGILSASAASGDAGRDKQKVVERVLRFSHRPVRLMMVPRVDVVTLSSESTVAEARALFKAHEFSRVLLVKDSVDEVAGYVYAKDLFLADDLAARRTLHGLERPVLFAPESQDGFSVLRAMQRGNITFGVVVDEYGGTSGIVTMEDLVEEVVGEIRDELDVETARVRRAKSGEDVWEVDARATVDELRDAGVPIDVDLIEDDSVGNLVFHRLGHLPRLGDVVRLAGDVVAEVAQTSRRRIQHLRVRISPPPTPA